MARRLIATVYVGEVAYVAGSDVPDDVASQISNPAAWGDEEPQGASEPPAGGDDPPANSGVRAELEALTKADLVALADARGVDASGSKGDLVARLSQD